MKIFERYAQPVFTGLLGLFFVVATHYLQLNRSGVGLEMPFNAMGWIPLSIALGISLLVVSRHESLRYTPLSARLLVLVCLLILPFFLPSANQDMVLDRMLGLFAGLLLLLAMQQFDFEKEQKLLFLLMIIVAVWVEVIIGWDRLLRGMGIGISGSRGAWEGSPLGIFQQTNLYASFMATGIVLSGYILGYASRLHEQRFQPYFIVLVSLPAATIHLLDVSFSRTGWFGVYLGVVLVLPYLWRNASRVISLTWVASLVFGLLLSWTVAGIGNSESADVPEKEIMSLASLRQIHFPQTIDMILEKPLLGYGYGRFERSYLEFTADRYASGVSDEPGVFRLDHPHNELLFWAAEGGVYALGIVLLAAWFVWQRLAVLPWAHRLSMIGVFFPVVLHTQVEYPFYQSILHWIVFVILIYWVDQLTAEIKIREVKSTLLISLSALLVPVLSTVFLATTLYSGYLFARFESGQDPNVESLQKMVNPAVHSDRINWAIMSRLVLIGATNNQPEQVMPYIAWAPELLERKPRPNFYRFLVLAYRVAGDEENRERVQREAEYLFPGETFEAPPLESSLASPVPFDAISR